jgi:hypothetical protein
MRRQWPGMIGGGIRRLETESGRTVNAGLATPDFGLVCANAYAVDRFCDKFESIELTPKERFHFMQLIVASLDEALRTRVLSAQQSEQRVERLLARNIVDYQYIIDYWGRTGVDIDLRVAPMMQRLKPALNG